MRRPARCNALLLIALAPLATDGAGAGADELAITGVQVVEVGSGEVLRNRVVVIRDGRIATVEPAAGYQPPAGTRVIDGTGQYLMPGLVEMHAHLEPGDPSLLVANGITTVREMNGTPETLARRDSIRTGRLVGPTMFVSSPLIAGVPQRWRHVLATDSLGAAQLARGFAAEGYDFLKIYDGLSPEAYSGLAAVSAELGIPMIGHIPAAVGLAGVLARQQRTIEHIVQIIHATTGHELDSTALPGIVAAIRAAGVAVTPTLASAEILGDQGSPWFDSLFTRPEMRYVPPDVREWWNSLRVPVRSGAPGAGPGGAGPRIGYARRLTRELAAAGVPILVGTDFPNPLLVPGFCLLDELRALERAGLDRRALLRAVTIGAAEALGQAEVFGQVRAGMRADLVLLAGNPLEDLGALRRISAVVLRGRWLPRRALDAELDGAARARSS